ncbi:LysR family transcriptional regulator [Paraburkholderia acidiphila]|uniref:LysR family transcriptional regulator n=2 Tax=Paraburkholderia acidiphila TaxID=2571747 RepID=A0A7Z2G7F6_9BURK|nr:LysR family transcriptional regulator [Paraburkholderia acidiphila]
MDKLESMEVFVKTADTGSFAAAARALGMTPQMAGKHVDSLETRLGVRLLHRSTRAHLLTEAGREYVDACRRVLDEMSAADAIAQSQIAHPRGVLRITAPVAFGSFRLAHEIESFLSRYPEVTVELVLTDRQVDLLQDGFDVAFRIGELADSSLVARPLAPYQLVACASPGYLKMHGQPIHPRELSQHLCLDYVSDEYRNQMAWVFTDGKSSVTVDPIRRLRINDGRGLICAAESGAGIVMAGEPNVKLSIAAGRLVRLFQNFKGPLRPMHLLCIDRRSQPTKLKAFIEWSLERFSGRDNLPTLNL